ncbi:MAG: hypothetical protein H0V45_12580 [Actinobacteria bacterium]|nr:hypothetical protein [Actinomycetota bacterium]
MKSNHADLAEGIEHILRLRRAERNAAPDVRADIAEAREFIEQTMGSTVRAATAARLLGVSQTALNRWLNKGEVASVLTPAGRREIPLAELLDLLEEAERLNVRGASRPLSAVLSKRRRAAEESVVIDRLLPRRSRRTHRTPELHALAYHRLIAERLDDHLAEQARRRLARWRATGRIHPRWAEEWEHVLGLPLPRIAKAISADTPRACELRQTSPFAGALNEHERRLLVEAVERRASA